MAQVEFRHSAEREPIRVSAASAHRWRHGAYEVWLLDGNCRVVQGTIQATSRAGVLWVERSDGVTSPSRAIVYLEGDTIVSYDADGQNRAQAPTWHGEFVSTADVQLNVPVVGGLPEPMPDIVRRGMATWMPQREATPVRPAQFSQLQLQPPQMQPSAQPEVIATPPAAAPQVVGTRRIRIQRRSSVGVQAKWFPVPDRNEWVAVISGGVNMVVDGLPDLGTIDVSTDRLVIWTSGAEAPDLSGEAMQRADMPLEIYMEGNIEFRQGDRIIFARSMYYNIAQQYGIVLDAELLSPLPRFGGVGRLKADVLQQVDQNHFIATGGAVTTSRLGVPSYWFQADQIQFEDLQRPMVDPFTGNPQLDPVTGEPMMDHQLLATANNIFVYLGGLPVFYWPVIAADVDKQRTFYIDRISIDNDQIFGNQVRTDWNLYQLLGIASPPENSKWTLAVDYLSERGLGVGTDFTYTFADPFNLNVQNFGDLHAWGINDSGNDNLGRGRTDVPPETDFRGRVYWKHRSRFASGLQVSAELGVISDRNFLEQYYENEWDLWKDQITGVEVKQLIGNQSLSLSADYRVNEYFTQTSSLPKLQHVIIGQSLLGDMLTWHGHTFGGYSKISSASFPDNPVDASMFTYLPWEPQDPVQGSNLPGDREGARVGTRQELDLPFNIGPVDFVPYVMGDATYWGEDLVGDEDTRLLGQVGLRSSLSMWSVDPNVCRPLLNVNGIAHKITFEADLFFADSSKDLEELPLYDQIDDDSTEAMRHRMLFTTFAGQPFIPPQFEDRFYALRYGMQKDVTAYSMEVADDLAVAQLGVRQRWQTKRGLPGQERTIDWITLDVGSSFFPDPDRDNFGEVVGLVNYNFQWHVGDRFTVLSDGFADFFTDGLKVATLGATLTKPQVGTLFAGIRHADGPFESTVLNSNFTYRMNDKYLLSVGASYDFGPTGNIGNLFELTRIGESFLITMGATYDASRDNLNVNFMVAPRFISTARGFIAGEPIPPVGAFGLE